MILNQTNNSSALDSDLTGLIFFLNVLWYLSYALLFTFGTIGNLTVIITLINSLYNEHNMRMSINMRNLSNNQNNDASYLNKNTNNSTNNKNINTSSIIQVRKLSDRKLSVTSFYLLNLALCDFLYTFIIPFLMVTMFFEKWIFGQLFCKFFFSISYLCQFQSVFVLVLLSIDRYISINYPHKLFYFRNNNKPRIVMFIVWLASFFFTTPIIMYANLSNETCSIDWPANWTSTNSSTRLSQYFLPLHAFAVYSFVLSYLLPVTIIVILYTGILFRLRSLNKLKTFRISNRQKKTRRHITKLVLIVVIFYIISWTPYWSIQVFHYIYQVLLKATNDFNIDILAHFAQVVAYLSSAMNPIIYSYMNETFRSDLHFCIISHLRRKSQKNDPNKDEKNYNMNNNNIINLVINEELDENEL